MSSPKHWADIAETTTVIGIRILILAYRIGGPLLFKVCLFPVICFYFLFRNDSRRSSKEYLERVQKKATQLPAVTSLLSFRHLWQFGLAQIDKFAIWTGSISIDKVVIHNAALIEQLIQNKQGGIFAVSHLGNLEICHALTQNQPDLKLTMLVHTKHAENFNHILNQYTNSSAVKIIQVTDMDAAVAMQLSEKIEQGEFIAIAADRVPVNNPTATVPCKFLGEQANFPRGPFILANILAVPLILLICIKQRGTYHVYFETLSEGGKVARSDREDFIHHTAQTYAQRLEHYTCKEPLQWFNFYDFWHKN
jgi:predicted LPLAT superfamily acyltransferase